MVTRTYPIIYASEALRVPETPGVYTLENTTTGAIFVGSAVNLRSRYRQWHGCARMTEARLRRQLSAALAEALITAPRNNWRFTVLVTSEGMIREEMLRLEARAVERAIEARGELCLNSETVQPDGSRKMRYE